MAPPLEKIVYVEDEEKIQKIVRMSLERVGGFEVDIYDNGPHAIEALPQNRPDLILLDARLPEMTGSEILKALREIDGFAETPVIFVTANVMREDVERYLSEGAVDVISKPFDPMTLPDKIREIWNRVHGE